MIILIIVCILLENLKKKSVNYLFIIVNNKLIAKLIIENNTFLFYHPF